MSFQPYPHQHLLVPLILSSQSSLFVHRSFLPLCSHPRPAVCQVPAGGNQIAVLIHSIANSQPPPSAELSAVLQSSCSLLVKGMCVLLSDFANPSHPLSALWTHPFPLLSEDHLSYLMEKGEVSFFLCPLLISPKLTRGRHVAWKKKNRFGSRQTIHHVRYFFLGKSTSPS